MSRTLPGLFSKRSGQNAPRKPKPKPKAKPKEKPKKATTLRRARSKRVVDDEEEDDDDADRMKHCNTFVDGYDLRDEMDAAAPPPPPLQRDIGYAETLVDRIDKKDIRDVSCSSIDVREEEQEQQDVERCLSASARSDSKVDDPEPKSSKPSISLASYCIGSFSGLGSVSSPTASSSNVVSVNVPAVVASSINVGSSPSKPQSKADRFAQMMSDNDVDDDASSCEVESDHDQQDESSIREADAGGETTADEDEDEKPANQEMMPNKDTQPTRTTSAFQINELHVQSSNIGNMAWAHPIERATKKRRRVATSTRNRRGRPQPKPREPSASEDDDQIEDDTKRWSMRTRRTTNIRRRPQTESCYDMQTTTDDEEPDDVPDDSDFIGD